MAKVCNFRGFAGPGFEPGLAGSGNGSVLGLNWIWCVLFGLLFGYICLICYICLDKWIEFGVIWEP